MYQCSLGIESAIFSLYKWGLQLPFREPTSTPSPILNALPLISHYVLVCWPVVGPFICVLSCMPTFGKRNDDEVGLVYLKHNSLISARNRVLFCTKQQN